MVDDAAAPRPAPPGWIAVFAVAMGLAAIGIALYYFAAQPYFAGKLRLTTPPRELEAAARAAMLDRLPSFAAFAVITAALSASALLWSRQTALVVVAVLGAANVVSALGGYSSPAIPPVLTVFQLAVAGLYLGFGWAFFRTRSRAAWAGLTALSGVFALAMFFGSPKVAALLGVSVWIALIGPAVYFAGMVALRRAEPQTA